MDDERLDSEWFNERHSNVDNGNRIEKYATNNMDEAFQLNPNEMRE